MPLVPFIRQNIEIPVSDRIINDTVIRQKARFERLLHTQQVNGECNARIDVIVELYAADGQGFGPKLTSPGINSYNVSLYADNNTLVDLTPGSEGTILMIRKGESDEAWNYLINQFEQPVMLQGDFFEVLRESQDIRIGDMIRFHIQQADTMGKFKQ